MQSIMTANIGPSMNEGTSGSICQLLKADAYVSMLVMVVIGKKIVDKIIPASISRTRMAMSTAVQNPSLLTRFSSLLPFLDV